LKILETSTTDLVQLMSAVVDKARAELKSDFLSHFASDVIVKEHPDMQKLMIKKTAVLNWQTRNLEITDIKV